MELLRLAHSVRIGTSQSSPHHKPDVMLELYFAMTTLLSIKADGRFPYGALDDASYQYVMLVYTTFFSGCAVFFALRGERKLQYGGSVAESHWAYLAACQLVFLVLIPLEVMKYTAFGYRLNFGYYCLLIGVSIIGIFYGKRTGRLMTSAAIIYCCGQVLSIVSFPLNPDRSDMLPLITSALGRFLRVGVELGAPYGFYDVGHILPLTYLPGLWLSYSPASMLGVDPRWLNVFYTVLAFILISRIPVIGRREEALLAVFLLTPYLQYRHEIYLAPIFLMMAAFVRLLYIGRLRHASLAFTVLLFSSQLFWPTLPIFAIFLYRKSGFQKSLLYVSLSVISTMIVLSVFILPEFISKIGESVRGFSLSTSISALEETQFIKGIFLHWQDVVNLDAMNYGSWILKLGNKHTLILTQLLCLTIIYWYVLHREAIDSASCLLYMGLAILGFILFNRVVWSYFYLVFLFLMACYGTVRLSEASLLKNKGQPR